MTNEELLKEIASLPAEAKRRVEDYVSYIRDRYKNATGKSEQKVPLKDEPFVGMWADREDMRDSTAWVRNLRKTHWRR